MKQTVIRKLYNQFEQIARTEGGVEFWLGRDLQPLLGYLRWENFARVIGKARTACENSGQPVADHFREVTKMVDLGTEPSITTEHVKNNADVRTVLTNRGIKPEALPPAEDIKKLERRVEAEQRRLPK